MNKCLLYNLSFNFIIRLLLIEIFMYYIILTVPQDFKFAKFITCLYLLRFKAVLNLRV